MGEHVHRSFKGPGFAWPKDRIAGDGIADVHADIDDHPTGPQHLCRQHPQLVFGFLQITELLHQQLGVERPPFPVARMPDHQPVETAQPIGERHLNRALQVMPGKPLVVGSTHLVPQGDAALVT